MSRAERLCRQLEELARRGQLSDFEHPATTGTDFVEDTAKMLPFPSDGSSQVTVNGIRNDGYLNDVITLDDLPFHGGRRD